MVGLRLLRRNASDRPRALCARAYAAGRDGGRGLRLDRIAGGRAHRARATGRRGAGERRCRSRLHIAADRAVRGGIQARRRDAADRQRGGRRRPAAGRGLPPLRDYRLDLTILYGAIRAFTLSTRAIAGASTMRNVTKLSATTIGVQAQITNQCCAALNRAAPAASNTNLNAANSTRPCSR